MSMPYQPGALSQRRRPSTRDVSDFPHPSSVRHAAQRARADDTRTPSPESATAQGSQPSRTVSQRAPARRTEPSKAPSDQARHDAATTAPPPTTPKPPRPPSSHHGTVHSSDPPPPSHPPRGNTREGRRSHRTPHHDEGTNQPNSQPPSGPTPGNEQDPDENAKPKTPPYASCATNPCSKRPQAQPPETGQSPRPTDEQQATAPTPLPSAPTTGLPTPSSQQQHAHHQTA